MTSGRLESSHFPYLPLSIELRGRVLEVDALIDTGFDGDVTLPLALIGSEERVDEEIGAYLADGSRIVIPSFQAAVRTGGLENLPIRLLALGDEPSVGRRITDRFRLILDHGERVILEP